MKSAKRIAKKRVAKAVDTENSFSIHDFPAPAILYSKKNAVILEWNIAASRLLGYKPDERPSLKVIREKGMRARRNISKSKTGVSMGIIPHTTKNGEEKLIEVINKQITIKGKECCLEWLVDQTALVQTQLSNLHFYGAVTRASIVSRADLNGNITYVNSNFIKISGYSQKELLGKNHRIINSRHHPKLFWLNMWKTITSGKTWRGDVKNRAKNGSYYWVDTFIMPFTDSKGELIEYLSIRNDITSRKLQEIELKEAEKTLRRAQAVASIGSWEVIGEEDEIIWSDEFYLLHGLAPQSVKPTSLLRLSMVHIDDREKIKRAIANAIQFGNPYAIEKRIVRPDGEVRWVLSQGEAYNDPISGRKKMVGTLLDITSNKKSEEAMSQINARLSETLIFGKMGSVELNRHTSMLTMSKEMLILLGLNEQVPRLMLLQEFITTYICPEYREYIQLKIKEGFSLEGGQKVISAQFEMNTIEGTKIWIDAKCIFKDNEALCILQDITNKKRSDAAIMSQSDMIHNMLKGITDGFFATDRELNFILVSPVFAALAQMKEEDMVGRNLLEVFPFMKGRPLTATYKEAIETGQSVVVENLSDLESGEVFQINVYPNPQGLFVYYKDISQSKKSEKALISNWESYENLFEQNPLPLWIYDIDSLNFIQVNDTAVAKYGYSKEEFLKMRIQDIRPAEDVHKLQQAAPLSPGYSHSGTWRHQLKNGSLIDVEIISHSIYHEGKNCRFVIANDITERIRIQKEVRENEERFRTLITDISIGILLQGPHSEIHLTNQAALDLLGLTEDQLLGRTSYNPAWNVIHEDGSDFLNKEFPVPMAIATKLPVRGVIMGVHRTKKNDRVWLLVDAIPRLDEEGNIKNVICTFNDISQLKKAEHSLQFTRFTIDRSTNPIFWIRRNGTLADFNPAAYQSLGYDHKEMLMMSVSDIDANYNQQVWPQHWKELKEKKSITFQSKQKRKDGIEIDVEINANFIIFDGQEFNCAFVRDITDRKKSEQELLNSNYEKDILIKEIHHRVKNNLQLISSILYIKMNQMKQSDIKDFLEDTRQKIRSIALIHERLLQTNSVNLIDISDYLGKLISDLEMSNIRQELKIDMEQSIEQEEMNLDTAIYCGLIINELVTNSIKHAFVDRTAGKISIVLRRMGDIHQLMVSDDGISMPNEIGVGQNGSFGMQMLEIFIKQLKGKVEIDRENGTSFNILF